MINKDNYLHMIV